MELEEQFWGLDIFMYFFILYIREVAFRIRILELMNARVRIAG